MSAILSWYHVSEKKSVFKLISCNLAVDDVSASSGTRLPGGHQWDYNPQVTFIIAKSLKTT